MGKVKGEIKELREEVKKHDLLYDKGKPVITDTQYDVLYNQLVNLEKKYPEYKTDDSPTQKIYTVLMDELKRVEHSKELLSLEKVNDEEGVLNFLNRFSEDDVISIGVKEDGLSIKLRYENGVLVQASTRGDGKVGEDVTHSIRLLDSVPNYIEYEGVLEVRGEAVIPFKDFERVNADGRYKSPRNLVSGSVRTLDARIARDRGVMINVFDILNAEDLGHQTEDESFEFLVNMGFQVTKFTFIKNKNKGEIANYCESFSMIKRDQIGHIIDGLVLKVSSYKERERMGTTSKYPKWAVAYKFDSMDETTAIMNVEWTVGKTGQVTPNAILYPVEIDGVTISKASLANYANIQNRDIRIGDVVVVARAGDVIPQVVSPVKEERTGNERVIELIDKCPSCGSELTKELGKDGNGEEAVTLYCVDSKCGAQVVRVLENFVSRNAMDIDGLGIETINTLYNKGILTDIESFYTLKDKTQEIKELDGFGERKVSRMVNGIEKSKKQPLENVIRGLGVRNIGNNVSEILTNEYKTWEELKGSVKSGKLEEYLNNTKGIGKVLKEDILNAFTADEVVGTLDNLEKLGCKLEQPVEVVEEQGDSLVNQTFVLTGKLSKSRKEVQKMIEDHGGKVMSNVSKNTKYLVLGGYNESTGEFEGRVSSKHKRALDLNVPIISEDKLVTLIGS